MTHHRRKQCNIICVYRWLFDSEIWFWQRRLGEAERGVAGVDTPQTLNPKPSFIGIQRTALLDGCCCREEDSLSTSRRGG